MQKKLILCVCSCVLLGYVARQGVAQSFEILSASAHYNSAFVGLPIETIHISKPKRTKVSYILLLTKLKEGDIYTKELHENVYYRLERSFLFYDISIIPERSSINATSDGTAERESITLRITVTDKWTLFPIPIFFTNASETGAGITLIESNLFGYGKLLLVSGLFSNLKYTFNLLYVDRNFVNAPVRWVLGTKVTMLGEEDYAYGSAQEWGTLMPSNTKINKKIRAFQGLRITGYTEGKYAITDDFAVGLGVFYTTFQNDFILNQNFETKNQLPSAWSVPIYLEITYDGQRTYGNILRKGMYTTLKYEFSMITSTAFYHNVSSSVQYSLGAGKSERNLFTIYGDGYIGNTPMVHAPLLGSSNTTRSTSRNIRSTTYLSSALEHSIVVWRNSSVGVISSYGGDISWYEGNGYEEEEGPLLNGGVFVSSGVSMKQLALPVFGIVLGYNIVGEYLTLGVSLGTSNR